MMPFLLNWMLPDISGRSVLAAIRLDMSPTQLPIVVISADDDERSVTSALEIGANDFVTRPLSLPAVIARLQTHIRMAEMEANLRRRTELLEQAQDRMQADLAYAGRIQRSLIPDNVPNPDGWRIACAYRPCDDLGGDSLNLHLIDKSNLALCISDVSGYGVAASLLAVTINHMLRSGGRQSIVSEEIDGVTVAVEPLEVAKELNGSFQISREAMQYFTMIYGILDFDASTLRYVQAGHPSPIHCDGSKAEYQRGTGVPIGLMPEANWTESIVHLNPGERVWLYTDGLMEADRCPEPGKVDQFGKERLCTHIQERHHQPLQEAADGLIADVSSWCGEHPRQTITRY